MTFCTELETEGDGWKARLPCWHGWSRAALTGISKQGNITMKRLLLCAETRPPHFI